MPRTDRHIWIMVSLWVLLSGAALFAHPLCPCTRATLVELESLTYFGAYTSGQVLLYGTDSRLRFAGGITPSRGHSGENPGRSTLISSIMNDAGISSMTPVLNPVFGCSLHDTEENDRKLPLAPVSSLPRDSNDRGPLKNGPAGEPSLILSKRV